MADPKIDELLLDFLREQRAAKDKGVTLESVLHAQANLADAFAAHDRKDDDRFRTIGEQYTSIDRRLVHAEADVEHLVDKSETTGEHAIDAIREAAEAKGLAEARRSPRPPPHPGLWSRMVSSSSAKAAAIATAAGLGWLLRHLAGH
jgi:hypothetical protein